MKKRIGVEDTARVLYAEKEKRSTMNHTTQGAHTKAAALPHRHAIPVSSEDMVSTWIILAALADPTMPVSVLDEAPGPLIETSAREDRRLTREA